MKILCVGGAGYIGSFVARGLHSKGYQVEVLDNLSSGHRAALFTEIKLHHIDYGEVSEEFLSGFNYFILLAGKIRVDESMDNPWLYWHENVFKLANFLDKIPQDSVVIYSSSAAVYKPKNHPLKESDYLGPSSVYGATKAAAESLIEHLALDKNKIRAICLRYFNAAGASADGKFGEDHSPETHLIPLLCKFALGQTERFVIFGDDWETADGTCVRDFIHVEDLAAAHILALEFLKKSDARFEVINLGAGTGFSVKQVISELETILQRKLKIEVSAKRPGDVPFLVADIQKAKDLLNWSPSFTLSDILKSALQFHKSKPTGYPDFDS